jgi:hypothetical protein
LHWSSSKIYPKLVFVVSLQNGCKYITVETVFTTNQPGVWLLLGSWRNMGATNAVSSVWVNNLDFEASFFRPFS